MRRSRALPSKGSRGQCKWSWSAAGREGKECVFGDSSVNVVG